MQALPPAERSFITPSSFPATEGDRHRMSSRTQQDNKGFIMFEGTMAIHGTFESECIDFNQLKSLTDIVRRNTFKN